jgi:hypothetical protein
MGAFLRYLRFDKIAATLYSSSGIFWGVARERFQLILERRSCVAIRPKLIRLFGAITFPGR